MAGAEGSAGRQSELEPVVSLVDVLEEDEELENEACAVLGGSDSEKCSYSQVGARPGPRFPRSPAEPPVPDPTCLIPARVARLPGGGPGSRFVVGFSVPGPAALKPQPPGSSFLACGQQGPLLPVFLRPVPRDSPGFGPGAPALSFLSRLSLVPRLLFINCPRDLSDPDIFVLTFPILRVFIRNRMGESKQS